MENLSMTEIFDVADKLYRYMNPVGNMCTPNIAYELSEKWYKEYEVSNTDLPFYDWCIENKSTPKINL